MGSRLQRIGPYRIDSRLGAGGMGEVYRAWDERLERWVAIKFIRPESAESDKARERFRREARAAASLSHPSLVQIHDILVEEEGDAIVMELVEGESLARRIARGPLSVRETLRLGRDIAEGLASAHAKGLIHRDLKPENVMVTADGRAKILDFGLAKRLEGEAGLTQDSVVVGTFRSMSPEQARGLPLDARSDLFSLGTLLYEMLAGRSPFAGDSTLDILTRVCTARQTPLWDCVPDISPGLSELVDRLLEKDSAFRPQSAREVSAALEGLASTSSASRLGDDQATWVDAPGSGPPVRPVTARGMVAAPSGVTPRRRRWIVLAAALAVAAAGLAAFLLRLPAREPLTVAVLKPEVTAGGVGERAELAASGLRIALLRELLSLKGISPLAPEQVDPVSGPPLAVARAVAADEVLTSRLDCGAEICRIALARISGQEGRLLWTQDFEAPVDQPFLIAEAVQVHLRNGYPDHRAQGSLSDLNVRASDYEEFLKLRREYDRKEKGLSLDVLLGRLAEIRRRSPRFLEAQVLEADVLRQRFSAGRDAADLDRAVAVLQGAREIAPADPRPLVSLFEAALKGEHLAEAEEALSQLESLQPGDPAALVLRARLLERRGEGTEALRLMREAVEQRPSWGNLFRLADMEYRLGEVDAARHHLRELLERFPGYHAARSLLAQIELLSGSPERAVEIYSGLVERSPQLAEIGNLGTAYLLLKRYPEAEVRFRQALALEPKNPFVALNLADVVLLQKKDREAEALYREVLELAEQDPAAGSWQLQSVRAQALAHLGKRRQAVDAAQRVLVLAQGNAQAAYEASLVYALVDDRSSALVNAERALRQGVEPRWFSLPWFDPLQATPELRELLRRPPTRSQPPAR